MICVGIFKFVASGFRWRNEISPFFLYGKKQDNGQIAVSHTRQNQGRKQQKNRDKVLKFNQNKKAVEAEKTSSETFFVLSEIKVGQPDKFR